MSDTTAWFWIGVLVGLLAAFFIMAVVINWAASS